MVSPVPTSQVPKGEAPGAPSFVGRLTFLPGTWATRLSYVVAIHLLGVLGFPGLLKDAWPPWLDYFLSVLYVSGILLAIYGLATLLFFAVNRGVMRIRLHGAGAPVIPVTEAVPRSSRS